MSPFAQAASPKLETTDVMIPSGDPGIELFVRNKHPAGMKKVSSDRILLFVHGATYPAETAFDLPIEGVSMMDLIAERGYDVYLVDVRGYGRSTRPAEMSQPAEANKPIGSTKVDAYARPPPPPRKAPAGGSQQADRVDESCRARSRRGRRLHPAQARCRQDQPD